MDNYCELTKHVNLSSFVRRVICILVILSLGHCYQVSHNDVDTCEVTVQELN